MQNLQCKSKVQYLIYLVEGAWSEIHVLFGKLIPRGKLSTGGNGVIGASTMSTGYQTPELVAHLPYNYLISMSGISMSGTDPELESYLRVCITFLSPYR